MNAFKLFGTDGIRSEFGQWPLTEDVIYCVSLAASLWLKKKYKKRISVIIGKDTRKSCSQIERYLAQGFNDLGICVYSAGLIPTPGLAYLSNLLDVKLGVMISASHNPYTDNGIKFFKHNGFKLSEKEEAQIERIAFTLLKRKTKRKKNKKIKPKKISAKSYIKHLKNSVPGLNLSGKKIVIDCANGAVSNYAEKLFAGLGATVFVLNDKPDGTNINRCCGSLHPKKMAYSVKKKRADIGFSFDGDGDRLMCSDERGRILDGDYMMLLIARDLMKNKLLRSHTVVGTSMSNLGLEKSLQKIKVRLIRARVGDKYVLEEMLKHNSNFGGEQSGHIIFIDNATTGDGMLTALKILEVIQKNKKKISRLASGLKKFPQLIRNVRVKQKKAFEKIPQVSAEIKKAEKKLKGKGRIVMRYSGTEPLARIMIEGASKKQITAIAENIAGVIRKEIGEN